MTAIHILNNFVISNNRIAATVCYPPPPTPPPTPTKSIPAVGTEMSRILCLSIVSYMDYEKEEAIHNLPQQNSASLDKSIRCEITNQSCIEHQNPNMMYTLQAYMHCRDKLSVECTVQCFRLK